MNERTDKLLYFPFFLDWCRAYARCVGAHARAGRLRNGLRVGHRTVHGIPDGHQLSAVRPGWHIHVPVR